MHINRSKYLFDSSTNIKLCHHLEQSVNRIAANSRQVCCLLSLSNYRFIRLLTNLLTKLFTELTPRLAPSSESFVKWLLIDSGSTFNWQSINALNDDICLDLLAVLVAGVKPFILLRQFFPCSPANTTSSLDRFYRNWFPINCHNKMAKQSN